jgi:hypothetical protein
MKSIANRFLLSAASVLTASVLLTTGVSAVYAQDQLTAHVPFSFNAGKTPLEAGDYTIAPNSHATKGVVLLRNTDTGKSVLMLVQNAIYESKDNRPRMIFRCASNECTISQVFNGSDGWQFAAPKLSPAEKERLAVVYFNSSASNN